MIIMAVKVHFKSPRAEVTDRVVYLKTHLSYSHFDLKHSLYKILFKDERKIQYLGSFRMKYSMHLPNKKYIRFLKLS
jgi:hypothetical protein